MFVNLASHHRALLRIHDVIVTSFIQLLHTIMARSLALINSIPIQQLDNLFDGRVVKLPPQSAALRDAAVRLSVCLSVRSSVASAT